jgi:predicted nuclease of predicted toxin-antitoxin system
MLIWIDAQLSPGIAKWIKEKYRVQTVAVRDLGLRDATDYQIFMAARQVGAVIMTKDSDLLHLLDQFGAPPQILWLTCGNTSNARLRQVLGHTFQNAMALLQKGEKLVEICDISPI